MSATSEDAGAVSTAAARRPPALPFDTDSQNRVVTQTIQAAYEAGITRQRVRVLLTRNPNLYADRADLDNPVARGFQASGALVPPDEQWQGGIMELYYAITPVVKDWLKMLSPNAAGLPPRLVEQRLDESGVDGEALWSSQCASAADDISMLVQPSVEVESAIRQVCESAGSRLVVMVNPQYRESDDTLDYISKSGGFFSSVAGFLGGKAKFVKMLDEEIGFVDTFSLQSFVVRGSEVKYYKTYPFDWRIFVVGDEGEDIYLGESKSRPDYNKIDALLEENGVALKYVRDMGSKAKLTKDSISIFYKD